MTKDEIKALYEKINSRFLPHAVTYNAFGSDLKCFQDGSSVCATGKFYFYAADTKRVGEDNTGDYYTDAIPVDFIHDNEEIEVNVEVSFAEDHISVGFEFSYTTGYFADDIEKCRIEVRDVNLSRDYLVQITREFIVPVRSFFMNNMNTSENLRYENFGKGGIDL